MRTHETIELTIPSKLEELSRIEKLSSDMAKRLGLDSDQKNNLSIAITEAVGNAIVHGNKKDPQKSVDIRMEIYDDRLTISVKDQGRGFKRDEVSDPLAPENMLKESGRGIFILEQLMDEVRFGYDQGTTLTFTLRFHRAKD